MFNNLDDALTFYFDFVNSCSRLSYSSPPSLWPSHLPYLPPLLPMTELFELRPVPCGHPAYTMSLPYDTKSTGGQLGVYARRDLPAFTIFGPYTGSIVGCVSANDHYSFSVGNKRSVDAGDCGNECRFVNDYRNTGNQRNTDSVLVWGDVFFYLTSPVCQGQEILLDYGEAYWKYYDMKRD